MKKILLLILIISIGCSGESTDEIKESVEVIIKKYDLTVESSNGGSVNINEGSYVEGEKVNLIATPNSGYTFVGWSNGSNENPLIFYEAITHFAVSNLIEQGMLYFEINEYLGKNMIELLNDNNFRDIELKQDIFKKDRMIKGIKR